MNDDISRKIHARAKLLMDARCAAPDLNFADADSDAEVRRQVVSAVLGDKFVVGRTDDYVLASFDYIVEEGKVAPYRAPVVPRPVRRH